MIPTCPDVTTTVADTLVLRIFGYDSCYGWDATYPDEHTGITVESSRPGCEAGAAGHCSGGAAYTTQAIAGATGTAFFQINQGEASWTWRTITIAVGSVPVQYDLVISSTASGTVTDPGEGVFTYDEGTAVDLVATPTAGYRFDEWIGDVGTIADVYAASTNITMNDNYFITANFAAAYDLTIAANPEVGGTAIDLTDESPYSAGTEVSIKAEAADGYQFVNWTAPAGGFEDSNAAETIFTMPAQNVTVTANFEEVPPLPDYPTATTQAATGVSLNSATPYMSYATGNLSQVEVRFAYKKSTVSVWSYTDWVSKSGSGTHAELVTGLDSGTTYDFKAQLKYDDTLIEGTTLQFVTDTPSTPPPTAGCCCAATTAYGTPTAAELNVLREFRDTVLLESNAGSQFVALYYNHLSPTFVDVISENEFLRTLVRELLLDPIVWAIEATSDIWSGLSTYTGLRV